ncbi:hypothetical protein HP550_16805 [Cellulomonas humilata]|uniref:Spore coat protein U domain-containing protein n=1 Tax=Cellulomonas humilata TaxID=144055 RepID=A0A7Y6A372_9CELL|nr:hypothetical protein [Cellulomonas humilata]NUU18913.1 hypothetical protein [Cellulomonas humilata]
MASTKSKKSRKGIAVALAFLGIAGLSLASAAQLNLTNTSSALPQAATTTVTGACQQTDIAVSFGTTPVAGTLATGASFGYNATVDSLVLTKIDANCAGKTIKIALGDATGTKLGTEYSSTVVAGGGPLSLTLNGTTPLVTIPAADVSKIAKVSVTIY